MKEIYIIIVFICVIFIISMIYCYLKIDVETFNIKDNKIDKNIKLMFLSDLHNRKIYNKLIDIINTEKPDIIIYGGDMINESLNKINNFLKLVNLVNDYKTYYTFGNHEEKIENEYYEKYIDIINNTKKIILLNNKSDKLSNNITINGLCADKDTYKKFGKIGLSKEYIEDKLGKIDKTKYNILVAHNPLEFASYVQTEYDLVLSGHIHGGVIMIPLLGAVLSPNYTLFPKYYNGIYKKNDTTMIVSRGIGFSRRLPFRIFDTPHVVIINLKK